MRCSECNCTAASAIGDFSLPLDESAVLFASCRRAGCIKLRRVEIDVEINLMEARAHSQQLLSSWKRERAALVLSLVVLSRHTTHRNLNLQ